jgi:hypothetical protein
MLGNKLSCRAIELCNLKSQLLELLSPAVLLQPYGEKNSGMFVYTTQEPLRYEVYNIQESHTYSLAFKGGSRT